MTRVRGRLAQLGAGLLTAGWLVGLPAALAAVVGSPLPERIPTGTDVVDAVTNPLTADALVAVLATVAWVAWVYLAVCLAVELVNATRRRGRPPLKVPGGGAGQAIARRLVAALLLTGAVMPTGAATSADAPVAAPPVAASAAAVHRVADVEDRAPVTAPSRTASPAPATVSAAAAIPDVAAVTSEVEAGLRRYAVAAPSGGYHDNLWDIAERHLGDGMRWSQIAALNAGLPQPGGDTFTDPDLIRPGWQLRMPADAIALPEWAPTPAAPASGPDEATPQPAETTPAPQAPPTHVVVGGDTLWDIAEEELGDAHRYDDLAAAAAGVVQPDGAQLVDPDLIHPGWVIPLPSTDTPAGASTSAPAPAAAPAVPTGPAAVPPEATPTGPPPAREPGATPGVEAPAGTEVAPAPSSEQRTPSEEDASAPWMLAGLTGAGTVLAASMLLLLRQRRRGQFRSRRPGRGIATPAPELAPVEKSVSVAGSTSAPTVELMDVVLRRLAAAQSQRGEPMPAVAAAELTRASLVLHLSEPTDLPPPWDGSLDRMRWTLGHDVDVEQVGPHVPDQPAPYPLLVTVGASAGGDVWLLNCEELGAITVAGDAAGGRDLARYVAAEIACNPWSQGATVDCVGVADEVPPMNPDRVRFHDPENFRGPGDGPTADVLADAVATADRATGAGADVPTARAAQTGDDTWPARLLLIDAAGEPAPALTQLLGMLGEHPAGTGTAVVLTGGSPAADGAGQGAVLHIGADGRLTLPDVGLDLVAAGLTSEEARGCAALLAQSEDLDDVDIPLDEGASQGWRSYANEAGALRRDHTIPRHTPAGDVGEPVHTVLDGPDEEYVQEAATTVEDLRELSPQVPLRVRSAVEESDPTLDDDLATWLSDDCGLPRLALLGPVGARTRGVAITKRKPYYTELLAYLATRAHGATPEEVADAFSISGARARNDVKVVRDWLGVNPRTGRRHLPDAREAPAALARGVGVYQVEGLLTDVDLFRRLRVRGESRGADGISDLRRALMLVTGQPFDKLRPGGWAWLFDGDRLDQHMLCAVVDVAHVVTTDSLRAGDLPRARAAAELAALAAPHEEIPRLDLAAVAAAAGRNDHAERIVRDEVCNRSDDDGPPLELPDRTQRIIDTHGWLGRDDRAAS